MSSRARVTRTECQAPRTGGGRGGRGTMETETWTSGPAPSLTHSTPLDRSPDILEPCLPNGCNQNSLRAAGRTRGGSTQAAAPGARSGRAARWSQEMAAGLPGAGGIGEFRGAAKDTGFSWALKLTGVIAKHFGRHGTNRTTCFECRSHRACEFR